MMPRWLALGVLLATLLLGACNTVDRLSQIGKEPPLRPIDNPVEQADYRPVTMPMPRAEPLGEQAPSSLWRTGAQAFFKDQRAREVGDVVTVAVTIEDEAELNNRSSRSRDNSDTLGMPNMFGLESKLDKIFPNAIDTDSLVDIESDMQHAGRGNVARNETIDLNIAAIVIQVLPNGNLVLRGRQEVRVNFEVRELFIAGIARPEDITPRNTIAHDKIAELRVAYGGRGQITDVQQPRYGAQMLDIILPY